ncbi:MAG: FAD binding domain-containing protein [Microbacteriaceae bacterium]
MDYNLDLTVKEHPALTVNGRQRRLGPVLAHATTLDWLRENGLTGCKEGCAEGECGACAIMVAQPDPAGGTTWTSVNACLVPVAALDGQEIVTSEGLGTPEHLHPVQESLAEAGGSQCGYCTPGFACSMASEFYREDRAEEADGHASVEHGPNGFDLHALSGNLCRCTGYRPIRDAAYGLGVPDPEDALAARRTQPAPAPIATDLQSEDGRFVRPASLADALGLLAENPTAVLVAGSTDWGVEVNIRGRREPIVIAIDRLPELRRMDFGTEFVEIGAAVSLSEIERFLDGRVPLLASLFPQFASRLIRNRASLGGNLGTGSPIGDTPPALLAMDARIVLASITEEREVAVSDYFTGYRKSVRRPDEIIRAVRIPLPLAGLTAFHKIAKRRYDDISSVAIAYALNVTDGVVRTARIGVGGAAAMPLRARDAEAALIGRAWDADTAREAAEVLGREGSPMSDHRASSEYRGAMLAQSMLKLYAQSAETMEVVA